MKIVAEPGGPERTPSTVTSYRLFDDAGKRISSCAFQGLWEKGMTHPVAPGHTYRVEAKCVGYRQVGTGQVFVPPGTREMEFTVRLEPEPEEDRAEVTFRIRDVTLHCGGWIRFHLPEGCAEGTIALGLADEGIRPIETRPAPGGEDLPPDVKGPFLPGEYVACLRVSDRAPVKTEFVVRPCEITEVRLNPPRARRSDR